MLKFLSKVRIEFNPLDPRTAACVKFLAHCNARKAKESNPSCQLLVKHRTDDHPPALITVTFVNGVEEVFDATSTPARRIRTMILEKGQMLETEQMFHDAREKWPVVIPEVEIYRPVPGKIQLRNPCRKGKKLLVLDIDYTLYDPRSTAEDHLEFMRPYLHEFLTAVYAEFDIIIWSATSMKWIEFKMGVLGVLDNPNYKITALLDLSAMITVLRDGRDAFKIKPLGLIWAQYPKYYSYKNTIMFDDLRRNFMMNPQNGLTIKPFREADANRDSDQELMKLTQYLLAIADLDDLSTIDHKKWESYNVEGNSSCVRTSPPT